MALKYVTRKFFQGKIIAYYKKGDGTLRYKLYRISKSNQDRRCRVKSTYTLCNSELLNKQIDELEEKVDNAIADIHCPQH